MMPLSEQAVADIMEQHYRIDTVLVHPSTHFGGSNNTVSFTLMFESPFPWNSRWGHHIAGLLLEEPCRESRELWDTVKATNPPIVFHREPFWTDRYGHTSSFITWGSSMVVGFHTKPSLEYLCCSSGQIGLGSPNGGYWGLLLWVWGTNGSSLSCLSWDVISVVVRPYLPSTMWNLRRPIQAVYMITPYKPLHLHFDPKDWGVDT
eukprot:TRINITY_DN67663_c2_g2_i1.p1 TRINITY_DN67663_c2_g2~~TRINITY_DN67663_c2_g2_i1.p1  ORF type:complete len:205 (-),score=1.44 TRINITY_DN67663_c2_g2_i1:341-955(-)